MEHLKCFWDPPTSIPLSAHVAAVQSPQLVALEWQLVVLHLRSLATRLPMTSDDHSPSANVVKLSSFSIPNSVHLSITNSQVRSAAAKRLLSAGATRGSYWGIGIIGIPKLCISQFLIFTFVCTKYPHGMLLVVDSNNILLTPTKTKTPKRPQTNAWLRRTQLVRCCLSLWKMGKFYARMVGNRDTKFFIVNLFDVTTQKRKFHIWE